MSPFSHLLHDLRTSRNIRQAQLAAMVGYDQTYISALEVGLKGPPTQEFVDRLAEALALEPDQVAELSEAAEASQRKLVIGIDVPQEVYILINRLRASLPELTPSQVRVINDILNMKTSEAETWTAFPHRIVRRRKREAQM
jgi:transcriptional regulator with XRE-family HTH domain